MDKQPKVDAYSKDRDLRAAITEAKPALTDNLGHRVSEDQNSLRVGARGPMLLEDYHLREKL